MLRYSTQNQPSTLDDKLVSSDPNSIVFKITAYQDHHSHNVHIRAHCRNERKYMQLKRALGNCPYFNDEAKLSIISDEYAASIKSRDIRLIRFFIKNVVESTPDLNRLYTLTQEFHNGVTENAYNSVYDIPAWDFIDERKEYSAGAWPCVRIKNRQSSLTDEIRLLFKQTTDQLSMVCLEFRFETIRQNFINELIKIDSQYWANEINGGKGLYIALNSSEERKIRLKQVIQTLINFDKTADMKLIRDINDILLAEDRIDLQYQPHLIFSRSGTSSSRQPTLSDQIDAVKYSPTELTTVLNKIADILLTDKITEIEDVCKHITDLVHGDIVFSRIISDLYSSRIDNMDDLKYILAKRRFQHHFLFTPRPDYYTENLNILNHLLEELRERNVEVPVTQGVNTDTVETLRNFLLSVNEKDPKNKRYVYIALMILSKYWPIDEEDYITCENISPENRVFIKTGHQYDLPALMSYHENRDRHQLDSRDEDRVFLQPNLGVPFSEINSEHIMSIYTEKYYTINDSHPLECLYDLLYNKRIEELMKVFADKFVYWHYTKQCSFARFARLPLSQQEQLIKLLTGTEENGMNFQLSLSLITNAGISLEQFATFDYKKQWAICFVCSKIHSGTTPELNIQGLTLLNPEDIKSLLEAYESIKNKNDSIEILNQVITALCLDKQAEKQRNKTQSLASSGMKPF